MTDPPLAELRAWLAEPLPSEVAESIAKLRAAEGVRHICLMPDVHLSSKVCVGAVVATEEILYPQAVGGDIGCGMAALRFDLEAESMDNERAAGSVLAGLRQLVPSNKHRALQPLPETVKPNELSDPKLAKLALRDGAVQLGTLGRGNHFLEFQADSSGQLWVMLHSGSRAVGQAIATHHLGRAAILKSQLIALRADGDSGSAYLNDATWARRYAAENRLAMLRAVAALLHRLFRATAVRDSLIHADHNHVQLETHGGEQFFVHRKGAQSARADEAGEIPGSMGAPSFHTLGRGCAAALTSCSHGAGRRLSRSEARRTITIKCFQQQVRRLWYDHQQADQLRDESPSAYKDIRLVMQAQKELTKIVRELRPILSYKG